MATASTGSSSSAAPQAPSPASANTSSTSVAPVQAPSPASAVASSTSAAPAQAPSPASVTASSSSVAAEQAPSPAAAAPLSFPLPVLTVTPTRAPAQERKAPPPILSPETLYGASYVGPPSAPPAVGELSATIERPGAGAMSVKPGPLPGGPEVSVILAQNRFYPSRILLREGESTRLLFTTVNRKPAALIMERINQQRWIARDEDKNLTNELDRAQWEMNRELSLHRITEVFMEPKRGIYQFHDALTGALGEIVVE